VAKDVQADGGVRLADESASRPCVASHFFRLKRKERECTTRVRERETQKRETKKGVEKHPHSRNGRSVQARKRKDTHKQQSQQQERSTTQICMSAQMWGGIDLGLDRRLKRDKNIYIEATTPAKHCSNIFQQLQHNWTKHNLIPL